MKFISLTLTNGEKTLVNLDNVTEIFMSPSNSNITEIYFNGAGDGGDQAYTRVTESLSEIGSKIIINTGGRGILHD